MLTGPPYVYDPLAVAVAEAVAVEAGHQLLPFVMFQDHDDIVGYSQGELHPWGGKHTEAFHTCVGTSDAAQDVDGAASPATRNTAAEVPRPTPKANASVVSLSFLT